MRKLMLWTVAVPLAAACGDVEDRIEDAAYISALTQGEGEALEAAPAGDMDGLAEEDADEQLDDEVVLERDCSFSMIRQRIVDEYDENGDGRLDSGERAALADDFAPRPRRRLRFARHFRLQRLRWVYDADNSGDLDESERAELRADLEARCEARIAYLLENFDADSDGQLSDEEWQAARQELARRLRARRQAILDAFDANGDGTLNQVERRALYAARRTRIEQRREELRSQFDADGSGDLDEGEKAELRAYLRARIRGEYFASEDRF